MKLREVGVAVALITLAAEVAAGPVFWNVSVGGVGGNVGFGFGVASAPALPPPPPPPVCAPVPVVVVPTPQWAHRPVHRAPWHPYRMRPVYAVTPVFVAAPPPVVYVAPPPVVACHPAGIIAPAFRQPPVFQAHR